MARCDADPAAGLRQQAHQALRIDSAVLGRGEHDLAVRDVDGRDAERARLDLEPDHLEQVVRVGGQRAVAVEDLVAQPVDLGVVAAARQPLVQDEPLVHRRHVLLGQARRNRQPDLRVDLPSCASPRIQCRLASISMYVS